MTKRERSWSPPRNLVPLQKQRTAICHDFTGHCVFGQCTRYVINLLPLEVVMNLARCSKALYRHCVKWNKAYASWIRAHSIIRRNLTNYPWPENPLITKSVLQELDPGCLNVALQRVPKSNESSLSIWEGAICNGQLTASELPWSRIPSQEYALHHICCLLRQWRHSDKESLRRLLPKEHPMHAVFKAHWARLQELEGTEPMVAS